MFGAPLEYQPIAGGQRNRRPSDRVSIAGMRASGPGCGGGGAESGFTRGLALALRAGRSRRNGARSAVLMRADLGRRYARKTSEGFVPLVRVPLGPTYRNEAPHRPVQGLVGGVSRRCGGTKLG